MCEVQRRTRKHPRNLGRESLFIQSSSIKRRRRKQQQPSRFSGENLLLIPTEKDTQSKMTKNAMASGRLSALLILVLVTCLALTYCQSASSSHSASQNQEYHHRSERKHLHQSTRRVSEDEDSPGKQLFRVAFLQSAPGLYDLDEIIRPLQGQIDFEKYVIHGDQSSNETGAQNQFISMVQYYMATCPDCQGFSPYFKRFVSDIGPHWRHLVRVFVVNCNDDLNINLCWDQNPTLLVPLVRWYTFPKVLRNALSGNPNSNFPIEMLNVSHRQYIEGERRDHISLRRATLKYLNTVMFHLNHLGNDSKSNSADQELFHNLPIRWHIHRSLDVALTDKAPSLFQETLKLHTKKCVDEAKLDSFSQVAQFIIASDRQTSSISRTVIADWSNWTCLPDVEPAVLIHFVNDVTQINEIESITGDELKFNQDRFKEEGPCLFSFKLANNSSKRPKFTFLISRKMILKDKKSREIHIPKRLRRSREANGEHSSDASSRLGRLSQRMSLEQYYNRRKWFGSSHRHPFRDAASMTAPSIESNLQSPNERKRTRRFTNSTISPRSEPETLNYAPPELYQDEELVRYRFNEAIYRLLHDKYNLTTVHAGFDDFNFGRINITRPVDPNAVINPKDEDLKRVTLTDYYKVLYEIVHKNLLSKAEVDGYQLLTNIFMVKQLANYFPFQGRGKSISRHFLELIHHEYIKELNKMVNGKFHGIDSLDKKDFDNLARGRLESKVLASLQKDVSHKYDVGLPAESNFRWSYCAGSSAYLRGHTCSLWILFHTLTVHEYQNRRSGSAMPYPNVETHNGTTIQQRDRLPTSAERSDKELGQRDIDEPIEYKFKVKYSPENTHCDPKNPDAALVNSTSEQLFIKPTGLVLADIINFIRFYLSCTNCAAHFSCMAHNSKLDFREPEPGDHLLWLWEAHNRVNVRTRKTHSEDPIHPKHVFPDYGACPACYIEEPANVTEFTSMRFNRRKLIEFVVARYQKPAILNNKIRIEDLFRQKPPAKVRLRA